jgi:hypothetical protein
MQPTLRRVAWRVAAAVVGVALAFFFVFAPLFTDGPKSFVAGERLLSYGLSFAVYTVAAVLLGLASPRDPLRAAFLAAPGLVIAALYALREPGIAVLAVVYVVLALAGSFLGAHLATLRKTDHA